MQQENYEIALSKDLSNKQFNALDKVLQDDLNISDKVDYDIFYESQNLPLALKCIEQKQFQQGKEKFDTDCNTNITTNGKWKNIYNKLQEAHSGSSQKITNGEKVNKDISEKFEYSIARTNTVTQQNIEEKDATLSKKNVKSIKSLHEQLGQNREKLKIIKSTQQEMATNVKATDIKKINSLGKSDLIAKNELTRQNAYLRFMAANEQNEIKKLRAQLQIYYNKCNMPNEKLEVTPRTDFVTQKTNMMNKILELKNEILRLKLENQQYVEKIEKFCCNEENIYFKYREYDNENSKNQKAKHKKYESSVQIKLMNRILTLYTDIKWWKQRFERNQAALITMTTEKQKAETELMEFVTKVTELQNMCDTFEKEKLYINALTSQKSIFQKESQQISEINSVSSNMENTLKDQVPEIIAKDSDKYYITLPSIMWRQIIMEGGDYNYITLPTIKIADTDKTVKSSKQVVKDFNKGSLEKLLTDLEDKMNEKLNKDSVKIVELLKDLKTNDKSTFVEEQVPTDLTKDFDKDCITSSSIMRQIEEENCDYITSPISPSNIIEKELDEAVESPKQVDKDAITEPLIDLEDINQILNKNVVKIMQLLEDPKTNDKSTDVEKQVPTMTKDFNKDCITSSPIMRQIEEENCDYITSPISPPNIIEKELDKALDKSPKQVDKDSNKDAITESLIDLEDINQILNKNVVKIMQLLENPKMNDKSTDVENQVPTLTKDFNIDCITSPSIMRQIEKEDDYDIPLLSIKNIADKESDKAVESPKQVEKGSNKNALIESLTDFQAKLDTILNEYFVKIIELLEDLQTNDKSTVVEKQIPTLNKDFDKDCNTSSLIIRQIEEENYDYDYITTPPSISPSNIEDEDLDKTDELSSIRSLSIMLQMEEENYDYDYITTPPSISPSNIEDEELDKADELPSIRSLSIMQQMEEENYNYCYIMPPPMSPRIIDNKELDKTIESPKQVDKNSNEDALIEQLIDLEDKLNKILNKDSVKLMELVEDLKTNDKSPIVEQEEQVQNKDKVADDKKKAKKDDTIFMKKLILSLPFYELPLSNITKDESIAKNTNRVSQSQPSDDYQSFENCSLCKKPTDYTISQQREKNQLDPNKVDANVNNNHIKCKYCNLAIDILMIKYNNTIDHVNNEFQTIENNKNREHGHISGKTVEEDQIIKL